MEVEYYQLYSASIMRKNSLCWHGKLRFPDFFFMSNQFCIPGIHPTLLHITEFYLLVFSWGFFSSRFMGEISLYFSFLIKSGVGIQVTVALKINKRVFCILKILLVSYMIGMICSSTSGKFARKFIWAWNFFM